MNLEDHPSVSGCEIFLAATVRGRRRTAVMRTSAASLTARERDAGFTTFMQSAGHPPSLRLDALRLGGVATGQDIAVAGFNDLPQSARPIYDLTTVEQQVVAMIGSGLDLLQARMRDKDLPDETISLRGRLIERGSSGPKGR